MPRAGGASDSDLAGIKETARLAAIAATVLNDRNVKAATVQAKHEATAASVKAKRDAEAARQQAERDAGAATLKAKRDAKAAELQANRDALAASVKYGRDRSVAEEAGRNDADKTYYQSMLDASKASIDRARSAAQLVQQAAAAIGTIYAGILGLVFSVSGRLLPIRGVIPALFLGFSIALSTVYIAFLSSGKRIDVAPPEAGAFAERVRWRLEMFLKQVGEVVERRSSWLRASVLGLACGVIFLPAPFVTLSATPSPDLRPYAWPSPPAVADAPTASIESILYTAQVAEVASARQRALAAGSATADLVPWGIFAGVAFAFVVGILIWPKGRRPPDLLPAWNAKRGLANELDAILRWILDQNPDIDGAQATGDLLGEIGANGANGTQFQQRVARYIETHQK